MKMWIGRACAFVLATGMLLMEGAAFGDVFPNPSIPQNSRSGSNRYNGVKKVLTLVVHDTSKPFTESSWNSRVNTLRARENSVRDFYATNSGGKYDIYYEDILDTAINLNSDNTRPSNFWSQANAVATSQGKNLSDYYMVAYDVSSTTNDTGWIGLSTSNRIYLQSISTQTTIHEIGHQVGADHAKAFRTVNNSSFHPYTYNEQTEAYQPYSSGNGYDPVPYGVASYEYSNPFDAMGNLGTGDFRIREKVSDLKWISSSQFPRVDGASGLGEGTHRIYAHDELQAVIDNGDYGVAESYNPNVNYGLTYQRDGQRFSTSSGTFVPDSQTIDIEYRSNADGAYFYLDGVLVDLDSQTSSNERLLEVGRSIEDTEFGLSNFIVNAGAVGQGTPTIDFLDFDPPAPAVFASSWYHIMASATGVDAIGSYIDLTFETISPLNDVSGDLNQDMVVNSDDLDLFLAGWLTDTSELSSVDKYSFGDIDFSGRTDLADAYLMRTALLDAGVTLGQLGSIAQVPEPSTLFLLGLVGLAFASRRGCYVLVRQFCI